MPVREIVCAKYGCVSVIVAAANRARTVREMQRAVAAAVAPRRVSVLVNCAGIVIGGPLLELTDAQARAGARGRRPVPGLMHARRWSARCALTRSRTSTRRGRSCRP